MSDGEGDSDSFKKLTFVINTCPGMAVDLCFDNRARGFPAAGKTAGALGSSAEPFSFSMKTTHCSCSELISQVLLAHTGLPPWVEQAASALAVASPVIVTCQRTQLLFQTHCSSAHTLTNGRVFPCGTVMGGA